MRFAVIGSNFIADWFMDAAQTCEHFELQTVYSRSEQQARANLEKWHANTFTTELAQIAADPLVDAVYIASPNALHFEQCRQMLEAGKHVLCEKPVVPSVAEYKSLLTLAHEKNVLLLEAMRPAHLPAVQAIRSLLPGLGTLRYAEFPYGQYSSRYDRFKAGIVENAFDPTLCNGALLDIGVYCIYWMVMLFGVPQRVQSSVTFLSESIDAAGVVLCDYPTMQATVSYSKVYKSHRPFVIEGENASLIMEPFPLPTGITRVDREGNAKTVPFETNTLDMAYEITDFMRLCQDPGQAEALQLNTLHTLQIMDQIRDEHQIDFRKRRIPSG